MGFLRGSLTFKISILLVATVFAFESGSGLFKYFEEKSRLEADRMVIILQTKTRLAGSLVLPLWEYNKDQALEQIRQEFSYPFIKQIILQDNNGALLAGMERRPDGVLRVFEKNERWGFGDDSSPVYSQALFYGDKYLGQLNFSVTNKDLEDRLFQLMLAYLRDAVIVSLAVILVLRFFIQRAVVFPVEDLTRKVVSFGRRYFPTLNKVEAGDVVKELEQTFSMMEESIQRHEEDIYHQLYTERVTGLPNRAKLLLDIQQTIGPSLIIANLNEFKEINEFYGPTAGDQVLRDVGNLLKTILVPGETFLYKLAADEFAILYDREDLDEEMLDGDLRHLFQRWSKTSFDIKGNKIYLGVTVGAALLTSVMKLPGFTRSDLFVHADMALKKAKKTGKPYLIFQDTMNIRQQLEENLIWTKRLREALEDNRILLYFQPIISSSSTAVEKYECLVRMEDENGQVHSPFRFLPIAKRSRLYPFLTRSVVSQAFRAFQKVPGEFSINLSIDDILDEETRALIVAHMKDFREPAKRAVFEILESEGIENYAQVREFLMEVKALGAKVAIDDFGTGYSNFEHILRLEVDYIKIDASLIKNIDKEPNAQVVVKTIVNFARELNLKTIAEFVHSKEVYETASKIGVDYCQGYYFGEPKPTLP